MSVKEGERSESHVDEVVHLGKTVPRKNLSQRDLSTENERDTYVPNSIEEHFAKPSDVPVKKTIKLRVRQKKKKTVSQDIRLLFSKKAD